MFFDKSERDLIQRLGDNIVTNPFEITDSEFKQIVTAIKIPESGQ